MVGFTILGIWFLGVFGWVLNIVQIVHTMDLTITGIFIVKCAGIFVVPLGAILGIVGLF